jgi:hypothetical protein
MVPLRKKDFELAIPVVNPVAPKYEPRVLSLDDGDPHYAGSPVMNITEEYIAWRDRQHPC